MSKYFTYYHEFPDKRYWRRRRDMAATKYSHPFLHGLKPFPKGYDDEIKQVREWMKTQPHLPYISDEFVLLFLHSNYYVVKSTQETIEQYFTIRTNSPELFTGRDPLAPKNKAILDIARCGLLESGTRSTILGSQCYDFSTARMEGPQRPLYQTGTTVYSTRKAKWLELIESLDKALGELALTKERVGLVEMRHLSRRSWTNIQSASRQHARRLYHRSDVRTWSRNM
ncbi:hypothetical protein EVAR_76861_1 [Eumeta japonica]|uniref:Uncharacterized protein n=1 Tax=Eumeta variegata TaxID=151549 RepID=A0A4C1SEH7_EUMVA|nr:hypothetical protein EVAR_76861_1 [Eumeta japonica]